MELKRQVVMLPTNEKAPIAQWKRGNKYLSLTTNTRNLEISDDEEYRHLHITSDEEIKEGDWCYDKIPDDEGKLIDSIYKKRKGLQYIDTSTERKIVASTDKSHSLPLIPDNFIKEFIEKYNEGNQITEVMVEYEGKSGRILSYGRGIVAPDIHPKIDKDNQINIVSNINKTEQIKQWLSETISYEGCIYVAVDKNGNSFSRMHNHKYVSNRQLVDKLKQIVEAWDAQLKANGE